MRPTAAALALTLLPALASAGACLPILGTVQLTPETNACTIANSIPGVPSNTFDPTQCFKVTLKLGGFIPAYGYAGVTSEALMDTHNPGNYILSPIFIPSDTSPITPRQIVQTARSTFKLAGTQIYAAEVIVVQPTPTGERVTEQSVITGTDGKGLFANATGGLTIIGNSIGRNAQVRGEVCLP